MDAIEIKRLQALATPKLHWGQRQITACQADSDDDCVWEHCPQLRDGEPKRSGRHCPIDIVSEK